MADRGAKRRATTAPSGLAAYATALLLVACAFVVTVLFDQWTTTASYAPLVGAVAISVWWAGPGPALVAVAVGWGAAWVAIVRSDESWTTVPAGDELTRWLIPLVVAMVVLWANWGMRRAEARATRRAETAERSRDFTQTVQELTSRLSSAVSSSDVANALVQQMPSLLGATGGALGLIDGTDLRIVDPEGAPRQTLTPGLRLPLTTRAPITNAARTGEVAHVTNRRDFEREFPDGARLAPNAAGALAVPLRAGERVIGSMGFPFRAGMAIDDDAIAFARLAADLGGQALERASLYEHERQSRETLDRITRLAPLFGAESPQSLAAAICREARLALGSDSAKLWLLDDGDFELIVRDPPSDALDPGTRIRVSDFPGLKGAMDSLQSMFVPDEQENLLGSALEHARALGTRSSLRVPIVIGGVAERALALQWDHVIPEPAPSMLVLARRFADQAGLALEQSERRVAQESAARNAEEARRLLGITSALTVAMTPRDVAGAVVGEACRSLGATAGAVVRLTEDDHLELIHAAGYDPRLTADWTRIPIDADRPVADAVRRNDIVALESQAERLRRYPSLARRETQHRAWLSIPITAGGRVVGALGLSFPAARSFSDADREFGFALARQAGQALERASLWETERQSRVDTERANERIRRLQVVTEALAAAATSDEVASAVVREARAVLSADGALVHVVDEAGDELRLLAHAGYDEQATASLGRLAIDGATPIAEALRENATVEVESGTDLTGQLPADAADESQEGATLHVPIAVGGQAIGVMSVAFRSGGGFDPDERALALTIARQCAQAIERSRLFDDERVSRRRSERLQTLTAALSGSLTPDDVASVFLEQMSGALEADGAAIGLVDQEGRLIEVAGWRGYGQAAIEPWLESPIGSEHPASIAFRRGRPLYYENVEELRVVHPERAASIQSTGHRAFAFVPLLAGRKPLGVAIVSWAGPVSLSRGERGFVETLASQCGQALDRARRYESERVIAETLQHSVLPETLPSVEGAQIAARYLPGTAAVDVGGDWFDTILLGDGRLGFVVGDVVGKGVEAAATMAQLRHGMRALALDVSDPAAIVTDLNRLLDGYTDAPFATLAYLTIDPVRFDAALVSAGHLPPVVVSPDGRVSLLEGSRGLPLGADTDIRYEPSPRIALEPGSIVVLYTDGLVERRDRSLDAGLDLLMDAAARAPRDPAGFVDAIVGELIGDQPRGDDVAVLAICLDSSPLEQLDLRLASDPASLITLREELRGWLERGAIQGGDARDILLAAWEAGANAIEHAEHPREPTVSLRASLAGDRVCLEVADTGSWHEPDAKPDRGLGLRLIHSLMTDVSVVSDDRGTTVAMERSLSREKAGNRGAVTAHS